MRQKKKRRIRLVVAQHIRFVAVLVMMLLWRVWRFVRGKKVDLRIVFQVYGNQRQREHYWPAWAHRYLPTVFPIGLARSDHGFGLLVATKIGEEELDGNPALVEEILMANKKLCGEARAVALAGRLPGFVHRGGITLEQPFVSGLHGTTYAVLSSIEEACRVHGLEPAHTTVAIVGGYGHAGTHLVKHMGNFGMPIIIERDELAHERRKVAGGEDVTTFVTYALGSEIGRADIVVNLSRRGDDMLEYAQFLKPGAIVLDDTHPPMHKEARRAVREADATLYKVVMTAGNLRMIPRLPDFSRDWVPGCLLEAIVVQTNDWSIITGKYEWFANAARKAGVHTELVPHREEKF